MFNIGLKVLSKRADTPRQNARAVHPVAREREGRRVSQDIGG